MLDRQTPVQTEQEAEGEVVAFRVADQDFCFDIMSDREIRGWTETTILPHAQSYLTGVMNLRGSVVPVIDLADRLGLGATRPTDRNVIIIAVVRDQTVGLLADLVSDILTLPPGSMQPVSDLVSDEARQFISGVVVLDGRMIRQLDLDSIVAPLEQEVTV